MTKKVLTVRFHKEAGRYSTSSSKTYDYFYEGPLEVEKDDIAVVNSPYGGPSVVIVDSVRRATAFDSLKSVEGVISYALKRRNEAAAKRRKELRKALRERAQEVAEQTMFAQLAAGDPEAHKLVEELKTLG